MGMIQWAAACDEPEWVRHQRRRGPKALGIRYEKRAASALPAALHGQWFAYALGDGRQRWCQPDFMLRRQGRILVIECKLSYVPEAHEKLREIYLPVVAKAWGEPTAGAVLCRNLTRLAMQHLIVDTLDEAWLAAQGAACPVLHWLGKGLVPQS